MISSRRLALALFRLLLLYGIVCFLLLANGWEIRRLKEEGWGLNYPLPVAASSAAQPPFLGINVELTQSDPPARRAALIRLRAADFGWVRQRFDWSQIEPQPGQFDWARSDAILYDLHAASLQPVVLLDGSPAWARASQDIGANDNPFAPPADPATFARFAAAFAQRYQDQVTFYQIWDEPNIAPHWGNRHIEPVAYAQLLKAAAAAIRQADPTTMILTAALAPTRDRGHTAIDELYFLQRLYAAGAADVFDVVAVQPFGFGAAPGDPREQVGVLNFQRIKLVRRVMLTAGDGGTPIWAVRFGWNRHPNPSWRTVSITTQRDFTVEALNIGYHQWPWLATMGWMIDQPAQSTDDPMWGFALTPALEMEIRDWESSSPRRDSSLPRLGRVREGLFQYQTLFLLTLAILASLWRFYVAARLLPWSTWGARYQAGPVEFHFTLWAALLILYYFATWPPLIGLCWGAAALLLAVQPHIGLGLAALLLPFHDQHKEIQLVNSTWTIAPTQAVLLCLLPGLLIYLWRVRTGQRLQKNLLLPKRKNSPLPYQGSGCPCGAREGLKRLLPSDHLALAWLLLSLLSSVNVWHWPAYWQGLVELAIAPLLLYGAGRVLITTAAQWRQLAIALGSGGLLVALLGLVAWSQGKGVAVDGVLRLAGPYYSPNQAALYLERTWWLLLGLALAATPQTRWRWWGSGAVVLAALIFTASRGAWLLGLPAGLALWLLSPTFSSRISIRRVQRKGIIVLAIIGLLLVASSALLFRERLANSTTILSRFQIWRTTLDLWQAYPLLGVGPGGFFWRYPAYLTQSSLEPNLYHPHNLWLEFGSIWGLAGLVWLVVWLGGLVQAHRTIRHYPIALGLLAGLVAGLAHAQVDTFGALPDLAGWNWLALALLVQNERVMPLRHDPDQTR